MLINPVDGRIIEFALGQSPYSDYLKAYLTEKNIILKNKKITLLYDGPSRYGIAIEDKESKKNKKQIIDFVHDISIDVDTMKHVRHILPQVDIKNNSFTIFGYDIVEKKLTDVEYFDVSLNHGCGPTAGLHIVDYWDRHGYPNLILSSETNEDVLDELKDRMHTFKLPNGEYATQPEDYKDGLESYLDNRYANEFNVASFASGLNECDYQIIVDEINNDRPGTVLYYEHPYYGWHYVTFTGYSYDLFMDEDYYIIHDGWTNSDVYRNWDYDEPFIWYMYKVAN